MCACEIGHVDEITLAGSIRGRIICAENLQRRTTSGCGINGKRNEMSLVIVPLAEFSGGIRAAGVKVAQQCNPQMMRRRDAHENLLAYQFGMSVRADRLLSRILGDGEGLWDTVSGART